MKPGDVYCHLDGLWICVQGHVTLEDWPPGTVPALWRRAKEETQGPDVWMDQMDYLEGDVVLYPDTEGAAYRCRMAHTSQHGWEPPRTPTLWAVYGRMEGSD